MGGGPQAAQRGRESEKRSRTKSGSPPLSSPTSSVQGMRRDRQQTEGREGAIGDRRGGGTACRRPAGKAGDCGVHDGGRKGRLDATRATIAGRRAMPAGSGHVDVPAASLTDRRSLAGDRRLAKASS